MAVGFVIAVILVVIAAVGLGGILLIFRRANAWDDAVQHPGNVARVADASTNGHVERDVA